MLGWLKNRKTPLVTAALESAHLPYCADIHAEGFAKAWSDGALRDLLGGAGMYGLVAGRSRLEDGGKTLGFVIYRVVADEAEVITIATAKSARGKGVGSVLMETMIRHCLAERLSSIFLEVDEANTAALTLYRKLGFIEVGKRKAYYNGVDKPVGKSARASQTAHDAVIMRLQLASRAD